MRTLSLSFRQSHTDEISDAIDVMLVTIAHAGLVALGYADGRLRLSSDPTERFSTTPLRYGTTSRGQAFEFLPFRWKVPEDGEEAQPVIPLSIPNFSPDLIAMLRSTTEPAAVTCEIVAASDPDTVEMSFPDFALQNASYDDETVVLSLAIDALTHEGIPAGSATPAAFPGLF